MALTYGSALQKATAERSFWSEVEATADPFMGLVDKRVTTQKTATLARLGAPPMPSAWVGDRNAKDVNEYSFDVTNVPYDATVIVDKELVIYQQWDEIGSMLANLGRKAVEHRAKLHSSLIELGISTVGDDGQNFFDTDHVDPGAEYTTSQDNDLTSATPSDPSVLTDLETLALLRTMFNALYGFKDDRGDPVAPANSAPSDFVVMHNSLQRGAMLSVANNAQLTGPIGNELAGTFTPVYNPYLTLDDTLYLFYAGGPQKPVIEQVSQELTLTDYLNPFTGNTHYSASWHGASAYGQWRTAVTMLAT